MNNDTEQKKTQEFMIKDRFRGFLPVVIDIETSGLNAQENALLEIAAITLNLDEQGNIYQDKKCHFHIEPFENALINPDSMKINGIDLKADRGALSEKEAITQMFQMVRRSVKETGCNRAVIVAHNAAFDLGFLKAAVERTKIKRDPFHPFASFDTASICGFFYGQTVLAKACSAAGIEFSHKEAHSALYDTEKTAEIFCKMVNELKILKKFNQKVENNT